MKYTSKELLKEVRKHCSNQLTLYRFNTTTLKVSKKYREERLTALEYLGELSNYYLQEIGIQKIKKEILGKRI